jgi:hypothetical protein
MQLTALTNYFSSCYTSIPGKTSSEKVTHLAKQALTHSIGMGLYRYTPEHIRGWVLSASHFAPPQLEGIIAGFENAHCSSFLHLSFTKDSTWMQKTLLIAEVFSSLYKIINNINALAFSSNDKKNNTYPPVQNSQFEEPRDSFICTLDDCGLTMGDYFRLDVKLPYDPKAPDTSKKRVEYFLRCKGVFSAENLVNLGIVRSRDRVETLENLDKFFNNENLTPSEPLPVISDSDRFYARSFNLLLIGATALIQLRYALLHTLAGMVIGYIVKDISILYALNKTKYRNYTLDLYNNRDITEGFFYFFRQHKTALNSPVSYKQRCKQIWEAFRNTLLALSDPYPLAVHMGISLGQTLGNYMLTYRGEKWTSAPTGIVPFLLYGE